jgi:acyl-CoA ligase (AMP-forming) (exosortase A-associated)
VSAALTSTLDHGHETPLLCSVSDLLERHAGRDRVAVIDGEIRVTYAELRERCAVLAAALHDRGVRKGDRVAIFLRRSIDAVAALFATWFAGGVAVIINDTLRARQVHHIVEHSEASCVITEGRQKLHVREFPCAAVIDVDEYRRTAGEFSPRPLIGADLAALVYTSGSTGLPKGVMLTHDNLLSGAVIVAHYLELEPRDVVLSVLPFSFDYGLNQLLTTVLVGATLVIQRSLFPGDICRTIERNGVTGLAGVPTFWIQLTGRLSPFLQMACATLRYITNSGGRLPQPVIRNIRASHPDVRIYLMYGLTEAFRSSYLPPEEIDRRPSSMGKAIPNVEILVLADDGRRCQPGEVGELVHRGANISLGYWRDPESTARVFRPNPLSDRRSAAQEIVVFSGDLVTTDADGYLYYVGRRDMQFKSRGIRVSPEEIERCVHASNLVSQAVGFAMPRDDGDTDIVVAVIPREAGTFRSELLQTFCRAEMPEYMWPRVIWPVADFPLTSSGKPDRGAIRHRYAEYCQSAGIAAPAARTA